MGSLSDVRQDGFTTTREGVREEGGGGRTGISGGIAGDGKESSAVSGGDCGGSCRVVVARDV